MNQVLAQTTDVWMPATESDKLKALASLGGLPSRQTSSAELDEATFFVALEGATRFGLAEAIKGILRGSLGHAFFPSPPELRMECDKAMEPHERERERIVRREQMERERREFAHRGEPSPEAKARVSAAYAKFCEGYETHKAEETLKLDPALVAQVPDNPKSLAKTRMGRG